ncbi:hypothetical protein ESCO_001699 [Escovopsis weberi]|uniref:Bromo domain-containing protein n=1 Tax=Escovopsis weberi TaxID=150374 RepID=A0A0M8N6J4_ESCWE|nr:hypothetical protein ESCO_001699 [Escovopsis weberi]
MSVQAAYTPLESLFLIQSLLTHGVDDDAFARISGLLKNNVLIKSGGTYDPTRLSPDALKDLFLGLFGDELRGGGGGGAGSGGSGGGEAATWRDVFDHVDRVPAVVDRLYARYRDYMVSSVREDERKFANLQREIQLLERSEKERLAKVAAGAQQDGAGAAPALAPRDTKAVAAAGGGAHAGPGPAAPGVLRRGATTTTTTTPSAAVLPPKIPSPATVVVAPKVAPPTHLPPGAHPQRTTASPKPPQGVASVLQAPAGAPTQQPGPRRRLMLKLNPLHTHSNSSSNKCNSSSSRPTTLLPSMPKSFTPSCNRHRPGSHASQQPVPKPPLSQLAQKFQQQKSPVPRPIAVATSVKVAPGLGASSAQAAKGTPGAQRWSQGGPSQQALHGSPSPAAAASTKDKSSYAASYAGQQPRPAIPEHMIRQAATPGPARRLSPASPAAPRTPAPSSPVSVKRGFGTKWATYSTPSTPDPTVSEPQSPAFEPVSPPQRSSAAPKSSSTSKPVPASHIAKPAPKGDATPASKPGRGRPPRTVQRGRGTSATPSANGARRSQSVASQTDELSLDHSLPAPKVKKEAATPRLREETGDTTADESAHGRALHVTPGSISRVPKRKRPDTIDLSGPPTHVLWTRGFTKVSSSALDQISSHRDANMFATALRERDAPNYRQIVLQPQDITSIRSAIKQGNKAAQQAANALPGGDPGTAAVWLPISDDLTPPKGIINSAHLERELVHMFCNAIMYNPDPDRGPGPAFVKRAQNDEEEIVGYRLDENGVVKNTQSMFIEVEKLLGDLRAAEKERGIPPMSTTRQGSVATPADDTAEEEDELAADGDAVSVPGTVKRRRINTRS